MMVTIDPSDLRPSPVNKPAKAGLAVRQILLAGAGGLALIAFTAGAFSFFSGLADPRAKTAGPLPVAAAWPDLKDGVPALNPRSSGDVETAETATVLNLPRPDDAGQQRTATPAKDFQLQDAPQARSDTMPPAQAGSDAAARPAEAKSSDMGPSQSAPAIQAPKTATPTPVEAVQSGPRPASAASIRNPPPIENAATVTGAVEAAPVIAPARNAALIGPSRLETTRAKSVELSAFVSLPPGSAPLKPTQAESAPVRAESPKPIAKSAVARPVAAKAKPIQVAPAKPPVQKPVMQASAAAAPIQATPAAAAREADDPEVMGVKIPGGRHVRDGWKAVFGGTQQN